jgi:hypothetical protein
VKVVVGLFLLVSVIVAYPWVGVPLTVVACAVAWHRRPRRAQAPPMVVPRRRLTTDDHLASKRAWAEMHEIERQAGVPYTPRRRPEG